MYIAAMVKDASYRGIQAGMLENDTTIHLTQISDDILTSVKSIHFDILFFKKGVFLPHEPIRYELKVDEFYLTDPVNYVTTAYFDEKALVFNISEEYLMAKIESDANEVLIQLEKEKKKIDAPVLSIKKKAPEKELVEIDLHIDQLVDNSKALSPSEMLDIQMSLFNKTLEEAVLNKNKKKRFVFIHGVGNGRLRLEIQRTLNQKYPKLRYQDASFKEYGFGATMVMISG